MAAPTALTTLYADSAGVNDILGEVGVRLRIDDDQSNAASAAETARLTRLYSIATARVRLYLSVYSADDLAEDWNVYYWSNVIAAYLLCKRRGNPVPGSLQSLYDETIGILEKLQAGQMVLADVSQVASPSMSLSNVRLDNRRHTRQLVVEKGISDPIPAKHDQSKDWVSHHVPEYLP